MDSDLTARLELFELSGQTPDGVVPFVASELKGLDITGGLTDDNAGTFTSHLIMALTRLLTGDDSVANGETGSPAYQEVVAEVPEALSAAQELASRISDRFNLTVPLAELEFLTIHLATIMQIN